MRAALIACLLLAACGPAAEQEPSALRTAAVTGDVRTGAPLDSMLYLLDLHLVEAMTDRLEGDGAESFRRAEAITDRLLEARMPFEWITEDEYSLQARLRQIQSGADRVHAQLRAEVGGEQMLQDLRTLRLEVVELRRRLTQGGGPAPPDIHQLLARDTMRQPPAPGAQTRPAASQPSGPAPIGQPVPPP